MLSRNLQRLVAWLAFTAALLLPVLLPGLARAAILPACESHEVTRTPPEWLAPAPIILPDACSIGEIAVGEDLGDARVAAMCSDTGASVVAPPRLVPVVDARIDVAPGCAPEMASAPVSIGAGP